MNALNNLKTAVKLLSGFIIMCILLGVVSLVGFSNMKNLDDQLTEMYHDRLVPIGDLGLVDTLVFTLRGDAYKYWLFPEDRSKTLKSINDEISEINSLIDKYSKTKLLNSEIAGLEVLLTDWKSFQDS